MSDNKLVTLINEKKNDLWQIKASYLTEGQEIYFKRALLNIMENKDIVELSKTLPGAGSILRCISSALQMGLQIGGQVPQAHIVAMPTKDGRKATLIPTLNGYRFISLSSPPVLSDFFISAVYLEELKDFKIDKPAGIVTHFLFPGDNRGPLIGVYAILEDLNGKKRADWMTRTEIENVRNFHSPAYKAYLAGNIKQDKCAWETDFDQQAIKTAGKRFLKPYAALKEGLAMALTCEDEKSEPENGDITDRVGSALDNIIEVEPELPKNKSKIKNEDKSKPTGEENKAPIFGNDKNIPY